MANVFNEYLIKMASDIGYSDPIPDDYVNDDVLIALIAKYDSHPSILSIQLSLPAHGTFEFKYDDIHEIYQVNRNMNDKKATDYDGIPCKLLKKNRCIPTGWNVM